MPDRPRRHFSLVVEYDGRDFHGWQRQPAGVRTVQGELEVALSRILDQPITIRGAGRTDAGVHALGQWAAFSASTTRPLRELQRGLNAVLEDDVWVHRLDESTRRLDPLRESARKTYFYQYHVGTRCPPLRRRYFAPAGPDVDLPALRRGARVLEGRHDFTAFVNAAARHESCVRRVDRVRVQGIPRGVRLYFTASGFLYNMVRTLASGLLEVGRGRWTPDQLAAVLESADRSRGPVTAPAEGLFLFRVDWTEAVTESLTMSRGDPRHARRGVGATIPAS